MVLDGELVIVGEDGARFSTCCETASTGRVRVKMIAEKTPALFRAFDLLARDRGNVRAKPVRRRRAELQS